MGNMKKYVVIFLVMAILPMVVGGLFAIFKTNDSSETTHPKNKNEKNVPQKFKLRFDGSYEILSEGKPRHAAFLQFYKNGLAILKQVIEERAVTEISSYEAYTYVVNHSEIELTGLETFSSEIRDRKEIYKLNILDKRPKNIHLQSVSVNPIKITGKRVGSSQHFEISGFREKLYINSSIVTAINFNRSELKNSPDLWQVTSSNNALVFASPEADAPALAQRSKGQLVMAVAGNTGPDYVCVQYIDGKPGYMYRSDLTKIKDSAHLRHILHTDPTAGNTLMKWQTQKEKVKRSIDGSGYSNGLLAGRSAIQFFIPFGIILLLLLFHAGDSLSTSVRSGFLIVLTLLELWYAGSLGNDMLWFITDHPYGIFNLIIALLFLSFQLSISLNMEEELLELNSSYSSVPQWLKYLLVAAGFLIIYYGSFYLAHILNTGFNGLIVLWIYFVLLLCSLPVIISYQRHSLHLQPMLLFMCICYPVRYILVLIYVIIKVIKGVGKVKVETGQCGTPNSCMATDLNGNTVNLTNLGPNHPNEYIGSDGRIYTKKNGSYYPNDRDNSSPYYS